jgi:hypothetical protein
MRVWLQKQKKKEEAKAASQAPLTPAETTPAAPEVQPVGDAADKPVESIEETPKAEGAAGEQVPLESEGDADKRAGSVSVQPNEVGLCLSASPSPTRTNDLRKQDQTQGGVSSLCLARMNMIDAARASDLGVHFVFPCIITNADQDSTTQNSDAERRGSLASQNATKTVEPSAKDASADEQNDANAPNGAMMGNPMMMNGMSGQMGYGFPNQAGFNNGMGFGMNNMMANGNWNGMNSMGMSSHPRFNGKLLMPHRL